MLKLPLSCNVCITCTTACIHTFFCKESSVSVVDSTSVRSNMSSLVTFHASALQHLHELWSRIQRNQHTSRQQSVFSCSCSLSVLVGIYHLTYSSPGWVGPDEVLWKHMNWSWLLKSAITYNPSASTMTCQEQW